MGVLMDWTKYECVIHINLGGCGTCVSVCSIICMCVNVLKCASIMWHVGVAWASVALVTAVNLYAVIG